MKKCNRCEEDKPISEFYPDKNRQSGWMSICIQCKKKQMHEYRDAKRATQGKKQCYRCREVKLIEEFIKDKNNSTGYRSVCKRCEGKRRKIYKSGGSKPLKQEMVWITTIPELEPDLSIAGKILCVRWTTKELERICCE